MKKKVTSLLFVLAIGILGMLQFLSTSNEDIYLGRERRTAETWPTLSFAGVADGSYAVKIENALGDRMLWRSRAIDLYDTISSHRGFSVASTQFVAKKTATPDKGAGSTEGRFINQILIVENRAFEIFQYNELTAKHYTATLNHIAKKLAPATRLIAVLAPTSIEFCPVEKYRKLAPLQSERIPHIYGMLSENILTIDVTGIIAEKGGFETHFRSDHHWKPQTAYLAYTKTAAELGLEPVPLAAYKTEQQQGFLGSLYNATGSTILSKSPDSIDLYYPVVDHEMIRFTRSGDKLKGQAVDRKFIEPGNHYLAYMGGDYPLTRITTSIKNAKKLLIIKDSYGSTFGLFFLPHYQEVIYIDPRYYIGSVYDLIQKEKIKDVILVANYEEVIAKKNFVAQLARISR